MSRGASVPSKLSCILPLAAGAGSLTATPATWLPPDAEPDDDRHWLLTLRAGALRRPVRCRVGASRRSPRAVWRSLAWTPIVEPDDRLPYDRLLPTFEGELGQVSTSAGASLVLDGTTSPPLGAVGRVLDELALHRVARATGDALLADVAAGLSSDALTG